MKKLTQQDLQIGDILIFEDFDFNPEKKEKLEQDIRDILDDSKLNYLEKLNKISSITFDALLHYLIAWFDPGNEGENYRNIYHADIWGNVNVNRGTDKPPLFKNGVVDAGDNGISFSSLETNLQHNAVMNIYVCRYKNKDATFHQKINDAVTEFYNFKGAYSDGIAWLLAVLCSLRYTNGTLHELLLKHFKHEFIVKIIIYKITELINYYNNDHQREMIACSPLVAMMYKNAGYELRVDVFKSLENSTATNILPKPSFDIENLIHQNKELYSKDLLTTVENWKPIKETVVTPRQLLESPDVELIGVLHHKE